MSLEKRIKGLVDLDYLKINSLYSGSSVNNLGIDVDGNVVIGVTGDTNFNYYVTGGTYNSNSDIITLNRNDNVNIEISGITDTFTTGGTYDNNSGLITFDKNDGTNFLVDLSSLDLNDTYITGQTFDNNTYILSTKRNDGITINSDLSILASDIYVVSGIYDILTGIVTYTNSSGGTFQVSGFTTGMTDSYTNAANLNGEVIEFDNNIQGTNLYNVNLSPVLSGKTNNTDFNSHTANTNNPHQTSFNNLISTAHTHNINEIISLQTELDSKLDLLIFNSYSGNVQSQLDNKIENGINIGGANELFSGKSGTDLYFRTISGGTNTTVSTLGDIINIDVSIPSDTNTYVTGFTYDDINTFTISRNDSLPDLTTTISVLSGVTYYGDGSNLSGISTDNFYVTGGSFSLETLTLDRNDGNSVIVTGFTSQPDLNYGEIFVGDSGNTAQSVQMTGDVNINDLGVTTIQPNSVTYNKMQDVTQKAVLGSDVVSGGTVTEIPIVDQFLSSGLATTLLSDVSNWDINGIYTGSTISNTYQGQMYFDGNYFFIAINDNDWVRLIRG